ncbi:MAG: hypothetical protein IJD48_04090 [Clostridia bacterium]|nr:hypothetical protein [Clostridia bacterium]
MKKIILSVILCFLLILTPLVASGCNNNQYTMHDIDKLITTMKTDQDTQQFFVDNANKPNGKEYFINVKFDSTKISQTSTDKGYIFPAVYSYYLDCASGLFFNVVDRWEKNTSQIFSDFSAEQINVLYNKLNEVYNKLKELSISKFVFEKSDGTLHYKNVIADYNALIDAAYDLNESFAKFYFVEGIAKTDFQKEDLSNSNVRDALRYILLQSSKVSYKYELLNFIYKNPLGEVNSWYEETSCLSPFIQVCKKTLLGLSDNSDLGKRIIANDDVVYVKLLFSTFFDQEPQYQNEYNMFTDAVNNFDVKAYFNIKNKEAYLQDCSKIEKSSFNIMQNFLTGRYKAVVNSMEYINNYFRFE